MEHDFQKIRMTNLLSLLVSIILWFECQLLMVDLGSKLGNYSKADPLSTTYRPLINYHYYLYK